MKTAQELKRNLIEEQYEWLKQDLENSEIFNTKGIIYYAGGLIPEVVKRIVKEYNYDATDYRSLNIQESYTYISCIHSEEKLGGLYCYIKETIQDGMITQYNTIKQYPYYQPLEENGNTKNSKYQA